MITTDPFLACAARLRDFIGTTLPPRDSFPSTETLFNELALELFALQFRHNAPYQRLCEARAVTPATVSHWSSIPAVPTAAFKELDLTSLPPDGRTTFFHSSGTTGQRPSRHFHDTRSLALYEASLLAWSAPHLFADREAEERMDLLILAPSPALAPHSSLVHMLETLRGRFGSVRSRFACTLAADGAWQADLQTADELLEQSLATGRPLLLIGTAFLFVTLLDALAAQGRRITLPARSRVMETGGYKGRTRALPQMELHALITDRLDVPAEGIVCEYGMCELGSQAYDRAAFSSAGQRRHLFPPWARSQVVSPETGCEVEEGGAGLLRIFDLANTRSVLAIQTEDLALRRGDGFELLGRAAFAENRGCSLMTA